MLSFLQNHNIYNYNTLLICYYKSTITVIVLPRVFMSDMANLYYNAFKSIFQEGHFRLFCYWHVEKS